MLLKLSGLLSAMKKERSGRVHDLLIVVREGKINSHFRASQS